MTTTANIICTGLHSGNYIDRCINHLLVINNQGTINALHTGWVYTVLGILTIILSINALQVAIRFPEGHQF